MTKFMFNAGKWGYVAIGYISLPLLMSWDRPANDN